MHHQLFLILGLIFAVSMLVMIAQRIGIAYPIFLVIAGLAISVIPGIPRVELDPELVFLIFLPPLLYEAAWFTSWNDFWKWKRPIALLAFGLVLFTSTAVAYVSVALIPGFTLARGFVLGAIISPPDAIAATTVLKGLPVPKRALTILEGESLVNDASSLIVFRFALAAVTSGQFSFSEAVEQFFLVSIMGIAVGLAVAHVMYVIHRFLPTTPAIDTILTFISPYVMYLTAEQFHFSGVMAVVSGGLFLSFRSHEIFQTGDTRVPLYGAWAIVGFLLNALVFILIGLALPHIIQSLGEHSIAEGISHGLLISVLIIVSRIIWTYAFAHIPRRLFKSIRENEAFPGWKGPLVIGWAGMRGVVSLATALSIPLMLEDGSAFPQRSLILFITFVVIFITLVFQGSSLPFLVKLIDIQEFDLSTPEEEQRAEIRLQLLKAALQHLDQEHGHLLGNVEMVRILKTDLENETQLLAQQLSSMECGDTQHAQIQQYHAVLRDLHKVQRNELFRLRKEKLYSDDEIRKAESQIDLDDLRISTHPQH